MDTCSGGSVLAQGRHFDYLEAAAAWLMDGKITNSGVFEISAYALYSQVDKINTAPSNTAYLTACKALAR